MSGTATADASTSEPIDTCLHNWHRHLRGDLPGGLDAILHEDCVFTSPIVFTPQRGREITKLYLMAAGGTLGGDAPADGDRVDGDGSDGEHADLGGSFRYVREIRDGHHAMLEFETTMDGTYVNGVDIVTCDDDGLITDFKVMIRPLQAINLVHAQMKAMLEKLSG